MQQLHLYPTKVFFMSLRLFPFVLFSCMTTYGQTIISTTPLPKVIDETSGLASYNGQLLTHNDSGGKARLYLFDTLGGQLQQKRIKGIKNNDWEDLAQDENYIYIADTGNNFGTRKNLKIKRVQPTDSGFFHKGSIAIRYAKQENFNKRYKHPFDAEGLTSSENALLLFSKNRAALTTEVYCIPKHPGDYELYPTTSVFVNGLITGADYNAKEQLLLLVGYNYEGEQFLYTVPNFKPDVMALDSLVQHRLDLEKAQIEAVKIIDAHSAWLTTEQEGTGSPLLFKVIF